MSLPILETERLILRPLELTDREAVFRYAKNPKVAEHVTWEPHKTIEDSDNFIKFIHEQYKNGLEEFAVCLKESPHEMMGLAGAYWISRQNKTMELEAVLAEEFWGRGYIPEALLRISDYCFRTHSVVRIQSRCKKENKQSYRMMEKMGMRYEGTLYSSHFCKGHSWDMEMFSLLDLKNFKFKRSN